MLTTRKRLLYLVAGLLACVLIAALPLLWPQLQDKFQVVGEWAGGALGGLGLLAAGLAIWISVYLESPEKQEANRLEVTRARATEAFEILAVTIALALETRASGEDNEAKILWTIRHSVEQTLTTIESCCQEGLYRLTSSLDGRDIDPFGTNKQATSLTMCLMLAQGSLKAILNNNSGVIDRNLLQQAILLHERLEATTPEEVARAATAHIPISASVLDKTFLTRLETADSDESIP